MQVQQHIAQTFGGEIWRMEIDELQQILILEIRNNSEKEVSFAAVDLKTGETYFEGIKTPERWLTGIEAAYDGVMLLHYYESVAGPVHKGLMAIDTVTGTTLWSNYSYSFDHLTLNGPVVYDVRMQPRKLFLADIRTGATKRVYEPSVCRELKSSIILPEMSPPEFLPADLMPLHPYGNMIHWLVYNNWRIVSLHALKAGELIQSLYLFDGAYKVYEDLLNSGIQKIQPEAFIMHKNRLIYIKNRTTLKVMSL